MNHEFTARDLHEYARLREEAVDLLDFCLAEGSPQPLVAFIDVQIACQPPRIALLRALVDDLQLRLLSLQEYRFDVRDRIVRLFGDFDIEITDFAPPDALDRYHQIDLEAFEAHLPALSRQERIMLMKTMQASLNIAAQLTADIRLVRSLHTYVTDWLNGLNIAQARAYASRLQHEDYWQ